MRFNKGRESEMNNYYGSPLLAAIAQELNKRNDDLDISNWDATDNDFNEKINI